MQRLQKDNRSGKPLVFDTDAKIKIIKKRLVKEGKIKKVGGIKFITAPTVQAETENPFKQTGGAVAQKRKLCCW